jgi:hypothetical protein
MFDSSVQRSFGRINHHTKKERIKRHYEVKDLILKKVAEWRNEAVVTREPRRGPLPNLVQKNKEGVSLWSI